MATLAGNKMLDDRKHRISHHIITLHVASSWESRNLALLAMRRMPKLSRQVGWQLSTPQGITAQELAVVEQVTRGRPFSCGRIRMTRILVSHGPKRPSGLRLLCCATRTVNKAMLTDVANMNKRTSSLSSIKQCFVSCSWKCGNALLFHILHYS